MAGDWIKMRTDLIDDPSVVAMAIALDVDEFAIVGRLHKLWSWADRHTVDGVTEGVTAAWIDRYVAKPGFAAAMQSAGWLILTEHSVAFPEFARHNGQTAKTRALTAKRVADHKQRSGNAGTVSDALPTEEKRREDESDDHVCVSWLKKSDRCSIATDWAREKFCSAPSGQRPIFSKRQANESRDFLLKVAAITLSGAAPEAWAADAIEGMRNLKTPPDNPAGYLRKMLRDSPHIRGRPNGWFDALLKSIELPDKRKESP